MYVDSTVDGFEWQGGYTEKANNNHVSPPGSYVDNEAWVFEAGVKDVKVLGGRLFGRFKYTTNSEFLIHSYGHTVQGSTAQTIRQTTPYHPRKPTTNRLLSSSRLF